MPEQKQDRRLAKTDRAIRNALLDLLAETPLSKISVSELARKADIDRKTFYLHYPSINALVSSFIQQHVERLLTVYKEHANGSQTEPLHPMLKETNAIFMEDLEIWTHLADNLSTDQMIDIIANSLGSAMVNTGIIKENDVDHCGDVLALARMRFALAGALSLYTFWLKNGRVEPIEAVAKIVEDSVLNGIYPLEKNV